MEKTKEMTLKKNVNNSVEQMIDSLVKKGEKAYKELLTHTQEQVDQVVQALALAGLDAHAQLAELAVKETGRGVVEDKMIKNIFSTEYVYHSIKDEKTVGIINQDPHKEVIEIAEPLGVIAGVTPVTNPTSTTMFKILIALKTRNPIIFAFHPSAQKCSQKAAEIMYSAAMKAGAPSNCIQWIESPSLEATTQLMNHQDIAIVLATGGAAMVQSAYRTGKPALGVGPGNVPCYIHKEANVKQAVNDLILSKTFDNGMICASEQAVIIDQEIYEVTKKELQFYQCYFLNKEELKKVEKLVISEKTCAVNPSIVGKKAYEIAQYAGINVPIDTKILIAELTTVGSQSPLSREKLSPVLACYKAENVEHGFKLSEEILAFGGLGHTAVIHTQNEQLMEKFGLKMKACRIITNAPSSQGAIGDIYNQLLPSLTLGCGSYGKNSTSSNVGIQHLINIKKIAKRQNNMQWFKVPAKMYFEKNSTQYLKDIPGLSRVMIITDDIMVKMGYVENVLSYLNRRDEKVLYEVFSNVEPDPSLETVYRGTKAMNDFNPDTIIALGGGSAMDAAKAMWLFYEDPSIEFDGLKQKFLDIRKRVFKYPKLGKKAKFIAIPTTSGTGSEVTPFTVITDQKGQTKYPLADYELTPDIAIIDPVYVQSVPPEVTADTGMDVLTHAIESYVSVMANDYTEGLSIKAIQLVFEYLPKAYHNGNDSLAREKMHNASTIAGMAFANAFLGINHSLAHKLGAEFHLSHGRANTILMPHVIRYNAQKPTKFTSFPKYQYYQADKKYAEIARVLGLNAASTEEGVDSLVEAIIKLAKKLNIPMSLSLCGIDQTLFKEKINRLSQRAFEDQCTTANPRMPLIEELKEIYQKAYEGV
ncbi:bifunctional acetaldehyde-CoA/alcohol dehydrogenase [Alkalihalobacillus trypoxylicola]|nr:bifunctional acetaldehyde-CoA/alcohol dehydrogenase [Alkalihalobacillus trypoxylicola]